MRTRRGDRAWRRLLGVPAFLLWLGRGITGTGRRVCTQKIVPHGAIGAGRPSGSPATRSVSGSEWRCAPPGIGSRPACRAGPPDPYPCPRPDAVGPPSDLACPPCPRVCPSRTGGSTARASHNSRNRIWKDRRAFNSECCQRAASSRRADWAWGTVQVGWGGAVIPQNGVAAGKGEWGGSTRSCPTTL